MFLKISYQTLSDGEKYLVPVILFEKKKKSIIIRRRGKLLVHFSGRGNPSTSPRIPNTTSSTNMVMYVSGTPRRDFGARNLVPCEDGFIHPTRSARVRRDTSPRPPAVRERTLWIYNNTFDKWIRESSPRIYSSARGLPPEVRAGTVVP